MSTIYAETVSIALAEVLYRLRSGGVVEESRNGKVYVLPEPVLITYTHPTRRVLNSPMRDANPFFHMMEALWMLAGRDDLAWPMHFNKRFREYSDDGVKVAGAYGRRWRGYFGYDQLDWIVSELISNPTSRRCVLAMWDGGQTFAGEAQEGSGDLYLAMHGGKDVPCNTQAYFDLRGGVLNMTVTNRSNDAIWGAFGANAVHFSMLQEYMAARVGVPAGVYRQFSNNMHVYDEVLVRMTGGSSTVGGRDLSTHERFTMLAQDVEFNDPYMHRYKAGANPEILRGMLPIRSNETTSVEWELDLSLFMVSPGWLEAKYNDPFFSLVVAPMYAAWQAHKAKDYNTAMHYAVKIGAVDWQQACIAWLGRRETAYLRRENKA